MAGQEGGTGRASKNLGLIKNNQLQGRMDIGVLNVFPYIYSYERIAFKQKATIIKSQVK